MTTVWGNVTESWITPDVIFGAICRRPDRHLFWDFLHPTKRGHELLGDEALEQLEDTLGHRAVTAYRRRDRRRH